ncbi:unnamed protein product [Rhizophagus irregularis]|nr:unnamed protein product [Rhizophagus irregularis]
MKKKLVEKGIFRIPMVLSSYFRRHFGGSFVFLVMLTIVSFSFFVFRQVRPLDVFCKVLNSGIGYWNLEMKGFNWVPGDWRQSRLLQNFLLLGRLFFGVLKRVEFRIILSILNNG